MKMPTSEKRLGVEIGPFTTVRKKLLFEYETFWRIVFPTLGSHGGTNGGLSVNQDPIFGYND